MPGGARARETKVRSSSDRAVNPAALGLGNGDLAIVSDVAWVLDELECGGDVTELVRLDLERHRRRKRVGVPDDPDGFHKWLPRSGQERSRDLTAGRPHPDRRRRILALLLNDVEALGHNEGHKMSVGRDGAVVDGASIRSAPGYK